MRNSSRFLIAVFAMQLALSSCKVDTFDMYKDSIYEDWQSPKDRKVVGNENDVNDLSGCPVLIKTGNWEEDGRNEDWRDKNIINSTGVGLAQENEGTPEILKSEGKKIFELGGRDVADQKDGENQFNNKTKFYGYTVKYLIYIGPWKKVVVYYPSKLWEKKKTEEKEIRFYAYQYFGSQVIGGGNIAESGGIRYAYEEGTKKNRLILEKPFELSLNVKIAPDKFSLCAVKWIAKFGYNAVAEVKSKNTFSKNYLVPTGRIVDSETGKIIDTKE